MRATEGATEGTTEGATEGAIKGVTKNVCVYVYVGCVGVREMERGCERLRDWIELE